MGIVTNSGGPAIMASDACESHGLVVPSLDPATVTALKAFLPPEASTRNPVDMIASATPESFEKAVRLLLEDPNLDAVLAIFVPPMVTMPEAVAQGIVRGATQGAAALAARGLAPKPVVSCFMGAHGVPEALRNGAIPSFAFPESAASALLKASSASGTRPAVARAIPSAFKTSGLRLDLSGSSTPSASADFPWAL